MKRILLVIVLLVLKVSFLMAAWWGNGKEQDPALLKLKNEVSDNLTQNLLPYWSARMTDNVNGGFYGRIDGNEKVYPDADKGGILNARILWTFSSAYRIMGDSSYLRLATRAKEYIIAHFLDKQYGGAYLSVNSRGEPADTRKQVYTQTFFIYGMAEYYRATGDKEAYQIARDVFETIEKNAFDTENNGYFEVFTRDWKRSHDRLIGEPRSTDEKTMNTHLHLVECYANLYRIWPDERMASRLRNLVEIFLDHIIDKKSSHLICFMDRKWGNPSAIDSYGHDIEASWLLYEAATLLGDKGLLSRVREASLKLADAAAEGIQPDGSMVYEKDLLTGHVATDRSWWPQSEAIVGYVNAFELSEKTKYLDYAVNCWNYTRDNLVDNRNGGWFSSPPEQGKNGKGDKAGFWICPYHNGRMCMEVIERVTKHQ